jgi:hypothetical protein
LDRENFRPRFLNSALQFELPNCFGSPHLSDVRYFFSVNDTVFIEGPWREGVVYVLPKEGFVIEPPDQLEGLTIHIPHSANLGAVKPLAKLKVRPEEFPFLEQVRSHNHEQTQTRAKANPKGFPWL